MYKYIILLIMLCVCWLGFSYHKQYVIAQGEDLVAAAYYGDLLEVKNGVEKGAPLGYVLEFDDEERQYQGQRFNALQAAASGGNEDVILFLLSQGLPINSPTPEKWTPLFIAARDGQAEAAKLLVFKKARLNTQTNIGATALMMAVTQPYPSEKARLDLITYMLKRGALVDIVDKYGHTALYYAQKQGNQAVVQLLQQYQEKQEPLQ